MIKTGDKYEKITYLNSYISKVLKKNFGKGPATCYSIFADEMMFITIKNFITPVEEVLISKDEEHLAYKTRDIIFDTIFEEIKDEVKKVLGVTFTTMYYDWSFEENTGILLLKSNGRANPQLASNPGQVKLIQDICYDIHKTAVHINKIYTSSTIIYVEYTGFMNKIEHILFDNGYSELLIEWNNELKKAYKQNKRLFEKCFQTSIDQIYVLHNFEYDTGILVFYLD
ncbi:Na-translocating system protein MpsC family protein [Metabacillus malikii]|uniref:Uncharacterized protein YbcI n=1 Tax=Metabacillus malikii TaxID=1504265 RepID=A0ABT9ZDQ9_9BACI|nr:Na-translocating system protein MpsC family protein [Metabacillus malikii]MDQ0230369.1 uncharacterized protein YbcI [Metabacillus malikii]